MQVDQINAKDYLEVIRAVASLPGKNKDDTEVKKVCAKETEVFKKYAALGKNANSQTSGDGLKLIAESLKTVIDGYDPHIKVVQTNYEVQCKQDAAHGFFARVGTLFFNSAAAKDLSVRKNQLSQHRSELQSLHEYAVKTSTKLQQLKTDLQEVRLQKEGKENRVIAGMSLTQLKKSIAALFEKNSVVVQVNGERIEALWQLFDRLNKLLQLNQPDVAINTKNRIFSSPQGNVVTDFAAASDLDAMKFCSNDAYEQMVEVLRDQCRDLMRVGSGSTPKQILITKSSNAEKQFVVEVKGQINLVPDIGMSPSATVDAVSTTTIDFKEDSGFIAKTRYVFHNVQLCHEATLRDAKNIKEIFPKARSKAESIKVDVAVA